MIIDFVLTGDQLMPRQRNPKPKLLLKADDGTDITDPNLMQPEGRRIYLEWRQCEDESQVRAQFLDCCQREELATVLSFLEEHYEVPELLSEGLEGAVLGNRAEIALALFERGARVDKHTVFAAILRCRDLSMLNVLMEHGFDINSVCGSQHTILS